MPFNKGDFTQQGVAGHVNANLRLNEKRLVNIDLTSNEEAEGCNITGTVKDLLNNKVYGIGSGVSGNIEITENGENINVAPFATATVNVSGGGGGGNIPLCTVTLIAPAETGTTDIIYWSAFVDNILQKQYFSAGSNTVLMPYTEDDGITIAGMALTGSVFEFSNPVNIDLSDDWPFIIDATKDSSLTVTVTSWGDGK